MTVRNIEQIRDTRWTLLFGKFLASSACVETSTSPIDGDEDAFGIRDAEERLALRSNGKDEPKNKLLES